MTPAALRRMRTHTLLLLCFVATAPLAAQTEPASAPPPAPEPATTGELAYPRDRARVVARVGGRDITLEEVVQHLDARHAPGFERHLATPAGNWYFRAPHTFGADWVRWYADIVALQGEARGRGLDLVQAEPLLSEALKKGFQDYLAVEQRAGRMDPAPTAEVMGLRLTKFQQEQGLRTEVQGWLDFLVSEEASDDELREFLAGRVRELNGVLTFAHILVEHRDPVTLRLLDGPAKKEAMEKLADVRARLRPDGSNFEEVAALLSADRRTAARGGVFKNVERFDRRLPAALVRAAWLIPEDGEIAGPVESPYGLHFVKRISFRLLGTMLFTDQTREKIRTTRRELLQEDLLFRLRAELPVELLY